MENVVYMKAKYEHNQEGEKRERESEGGGREREREAHGDLLECPVVVITDSIDNIKVSTRSAGYWAIPTVSHTTVHVASIETLKIQVHLEQILQ